MSRKKCQCVTCISIREGAYEFWDTNEEEESLCELCQWICEPHMYEFYANFICRPMFIPDEVREFLGMRSICMTCLARIDYVVSRHFRLCWMTATKEAIQVAILRMMQDVLVKAITANSPKARAELDAFKQWWNEFDKDVIEEPDNIPKWSIKKRVIESEWRAL